MKNCPICLLSHLGKETHHPECVKALFGTTVFPTLDIEPTRLYSLAASKMAGKMSISGVQEKVSLALSFDCRKLDVSAVGGRYILKPETSQFQSLPQNEHLSMRLAALLAIEVPPLGLMWLNDQSMGYIIKRFDRLDDGSKLQVEDFCQLSEKRLADKYDGSAELCVRTLRKYVTEPLIEIRKLFRLILFSWWIGNGDLHLKNFSLVTTKDGIRRLSPAYDLLSTKLVIPDDPLALSVGGKDRNLSRRNWFDYADYCGIPRKATERLVSGQIASLSRAMHLISASFLPDPLKEQYRECLRETTSVLLG